MPRPLEASRMFNRLAIRTRRRSGVHAELLDALRAHAGLVVSCAARVLGNAADAEDVAQDVAEALLGNPPTTVANWPALLKTMAVNRAIDLLRRRREGGDIDALPSAEAQPDEALAAGQRAQALRAALARLDARQGTLFALYYLADLGQAEIGRQLDMTQSAVGVALHRVRKQLADDIRDQLGIADTGDDRQ